MHTQFQLQRKLRPQLIISEEMSIGLLGFDFLQETYQARRMPRAIIMQEEQ